MITCSMPAATASSTAYWITGLSTSGSISFGCALVAGRNRVPQPAAGKTALRTRMTPLYEGWETAEVYRRPSALPDDGFATDVSAASRHPVREPGDEPAEGGGAVEVREVHRTPDHDVA